jgi:hypothetical protein
MVEDDARRLIRAINELQAKDRVGELVSIDNAVTYRTGLGPNFYPESPRCDAAVEYLIEQDALVREEGYDPLDVRGVAYGWFSISQTGLDMV